MPLRVGIINLMPKAETYEQMLGAALTSSAGDASCEIELALVRIASHRYGSSDAAHLEAAYRSYEQTLSDAPLHGLILSGAPVEHLAFEDVHYWHELRAVLEHARIHVPRLLGLCWGGMALAQQLGIPKLGFGQKLFGIYPMQLAHGRSLPNAAYCAQSRYSGLDPQSAEAALREGTIRSLAHGEDIGHTIIESDDGRVLMHLGHPEYTVARLAFEYARDTAAGRRDVVAPVGIDAPEARHGHDAHRASFFRAWLSSLINP